MVQATHGSSALTTTDGTTGLIALPQHKRYSSANSFSSASIVTVRRAASVSSSSTGAHSSIMPATSRSPGETSLVTHRLDQEKVAQEQKRRRSMAVDPGDKPTREMKDYSRRYSHATTSSATSSSNTRSRASSGAAFSGYISQAYSPQKRGTDTVDYSPRPSIVAKASSRPGSQHVLSPTTSPERERRRRSRPAVPALPRTVSGPLAPQDTSESEEGAAFSRTAMSTTPSTSLAHRRDYFAERTVPTRVNVKSMDLAQISNNGTRSSAIGETPRTNQLAGEDAVSAVRLPSRDEGSDALEDSGKHRHSRSKEHGRHKRAKTREKGERDKKFMLAQALAKANTAVLLDNAQNFEGALQAYADACALLQQVMDRSSGADDKRKLDAIKFTYTNRIEELHQLQATVEEAVEAKALPTRPMSDDLFSVSTTTESSRDRSNMDVDNVATKAISVAKKGLGPSELENYGDPESLSLPAQSVFETNTVSDEPTTPVTQPEPLRSKFRRGDSTSEPVVAPFLTTGSTARTQDRPAATSLELHGVHLSPPDASSSIPAPLTPRRLPAPTPAESAESNWDELSAMPVAQVTDRDLRDPNTSASWLDTVDEAPSSRGSSVHSVSSQQGLRRKHLRHGSGDSNQDLDMAFDTAMEAALDEGMVPDWEARRRRETAYGGRDSTDTAEVAALQSNTSHPVGTMFGGSALASPEDEEEERILDEITHDFGQDFSFDMSTKSALPRQSDSSGYSRSTWQSSQVSDRTTAGTSLSTVAEDSSAAPGSKNAFASPALLNSVLVETPPPLVAPPPQTSLPKLPSPTQNRVTGVRSRRLSSQNLKQLKVETSVQAEAHGRASHFHNTESSFEEGDISVPALHKDFQSAFLGTSATSSDTQHGALLRSPPSFDLQSAISDSSRPMTATTAITEQRRSFDEESNELRRRQRPEHVEGSKSTASLLEHTPFLPTPPIDSRPPLMTPLSSTFRPLTTRRQTETSLTSQRATLPSFGPTVADSTFSGGAFLFDTSLSTPQNSPSPRSPAPTPTLEPCPESFLLRPFWLMRNIASTLTHPRGAFITTQLFVPREVWQTKGVKLKLIDDKCAGCDLLTAALGQLAKVDTYDADAAMEELQRFEETMEQVQAAFTKKLGNDVGPSGLASIFRDATANAIPSTRTASTSTSEVPTTTTIAGGEKTKSKENKGYLSSWRKLRNKSSGAPGVGAMGIQIRKGSDRPNDKNRESLGMDSVPMTNFIPGERSRGGGNKDNEKEVKNMVFEGPYREYMGSLARLFEAVYVLDQIARQVEDPGLRGTSTTYVGLELSIRHAAEFFGFFVCRFVLADLGVLIDKFVKRGSEWVLA